MNEHAISPGRNRHAHLFLLWVFFRAVDARAFMPARAGARRGAPWGALRGVGATVWRDPGKKSWSGAASLRRFSRLDFYFVGRLKMKRKNFVVSALLASSLLK
jgi:hypothetical protein